MVANRFTGAVMPGGLILLCTVLLSAFWPGVVPATHSELYFAEPYSGNKVAGYEVELPVGPGEMRSFAIPGECDAMMAAVAAGAVQWGSRVEQRLWQKVIGDCEYHAFLHRFASDDLQDFVTGYDFRNTGIGDLLLSYQCIEPVDPTGEPECGFAGTPVSDIAPLVSFVDEQADVTGFEAAACRVIRGSFRGRVLAGRHGLRCREDPRDPGFRVLSVDYSDVNGDGFLDAVLRVVPIGPGASRMPLVAAYTRLGADAPLTAPAGPAPAARQVE